MGNISRYRYSDPQNIFSMTVLEFHDYVSFIIQNAIPDEIGLKRIKNEAAIVNAYGGLDLMPDESGQTPDRPEPLKQFWCNAKLLEQVCKIDDSLNFNNLRYIMQGDDFDPIKYPSAILSPIGLSVLGNGDVYFNFSDLLGQDEIKNINPHKNLTPQGMKSMIKQIIYENKIDKIGICSVKNEVMLTYDTNINMLLTGDDEDDFREKALGSIKIVYLIEDNANIEIPPVMSQNIIIKINKDAAMLYKHILPAIYSGGNASEAYDTFYETAGENDQKSVFPFLDLLTEFGYHEFIENNLFNNNDRLAFSKAIGSILSETMTGLSPKIWYESEVVSSPLSLADTVIRAVATEIPDFSITDVEPFREALFRTIDDGIFHIDDLPLHVYTSALKYADILIKNGKDLTATMYRALICAANQTIENDLAVLLLSGSEEKEEFSTLMRYLEEILPDQFNFNIEFD